MLWLVMGVDDTTFGAVGGGWVGSEEVRGQVVQFYEFLYEETKQWRLKVVDLILL